MWKWEHGKTCQHQSSQGIHILKAFHHAVYIKKIHLVCVVWGSIPQFTSPLNQLRHCIFAVNRTYGAQCDPATSNLTMPGAKRAPDCLDGDGPETSNPYPDSRQSIFHSPHYTGYAGKVDESQDQITQVNRLRWFCKKKQLLQWPTSPGCKSALDFCQPPTANCQFWGIDKFGKRQPILGNRQIWQSTVVAKIGCPKGG